MEILHEINIARFWKLFKDNIKVFGIVWVAAAAWALMIGFSTPKTFKSEVKLAPESASGGLGALGSIGSMMGLKLGDIKTEDAIIPFLYPDVVSSPDFLLGILDIPVTTGDGSVKNVDYKTYLTKYCDGAWWDVVFLKLGKLFSFKKKSSGLETGADESHVTVLSYDDEQILKLLQNSVLCTIDKKTDVITISVIDQDRYVAATMVDSVSSRLQNFITDYRTKKARTNAAHLQKLYDEALVEYQKSQKEYADFSDSHTGTVLNEYKVKIDDLENKVQMNYTMVSQLMLQLRTAQAKIQERTPVYTEVQAPYVPYKHIAPKKLTILLLYLFFATFGCFVWLYHRETKKEQEIKA